MSLLSTLSTGNGPEDLENEGLPRPLNPSCSPDCASSRAHKPTCIVIPTLTTAPQTSTSSVITETTALIRRYCHPTPPWYNTQSHTPMLPNSNSNTTTTSQGGVPDIIPHIIPHVLKIVIKSMPPVLLGCLLNILDGVSYGMILFPGTGVFSELGPIGVTMFFLSTTLGQLAYTCGGSAFAGANGSMMIEVIPFFHTIATNIQSQIGEDNPHEVIATTLAAFTLSSFLSGLAFFTLGALKLGTLMDSFPKHILIGCIGGVGAFLIQTGFTVSLRIDDDKFKGNWGTLEMMFLNRRNFVLWVVPLVLAVSLRVVTSRWKHQLIFPIYFLIIPVLFYIGVAAVGADLSDLRKGGWIFDMGSAKSPAWYKLYSYFDLQAIRFGVLWGTLPTQFVLLFFNILHPPLNVPALSISLKEDVDADKELVGHGYSNILSALFGTVPNYLVYVNTILFYRVGGGSRIAGFLLAVMTAVLVVIGTGPIAYIPVMVVGALVFVLGIDLVTEAVWDTRKQTTRTEYITIVGIIVVMIVWDFVMGVLCGIIASCFFFVVQNSQRQSIRSLHTAETAMSTVRRPGHQRDYLREALKRATIVRLQGFLFFGNIFHIEDTVRKAVDGFECHYNTVNFLILDLTLVAGVDMSSSGAFARIHRYLSRKAATMVFCGFCRDSAVAKALESVNVLDAHNVEHFPTFNDAMEWTENAYLCMAQKYEVTSTALPGRHDHGYDTFEAQVLTSGHRTNANGKYRIEGLQENPGEPLNTLIKAFSSFDDIDVDLFRPMSKYLEHLCLPEGHVLWKQGDAPDGLYIIESGVLRASYRFAEHIQHVEESMVSGTLSGELSALSALPRNATVVAERDVTLWKLSTENLIRLEVEEPRLAMCFLRLVLKAAKFDYDTLLSALASRQ